jgi:CcdB protein.
VKQFDVYENPAVTARRFAPFIVVLSSHLLPRFQDVIVAPLINDARYQVPELELVFDVEGEHLTLSMMELSVLRARDLKTRTGSLAAHEDDIRRALDRLFTGF